MFLQAVCGKLLSPYEGKELLQHISEGVNIYFNYTGTAKCLNISQQATSDLGDLGWDYQVSNFAAPLPYQLCIYASVNVYIFMNSTFMLRTFLSQKVCASN